VELYWGWKGADLGKKKNQRKVVYPTGGGKDEKTPGIGKGEEGVLGVRWDGKQGEGVEDKDLLFLQHGSGRTLGCVERIIYGVNLGMFAMWEKRSSLFINMQAETMAKFQSKGGKKRLKCRYRDEKKPSIFEPIKGGYTKQCLNWGEKKAGDGVGGRFPFTDHDH